MINVKSWLCVCFEDEEGKVEDKKLVLMRIYFIEMLTVPALSPFNLFALVSAEHLRKKK